MLTAKKVEREKRPGRYRDDRNLYLVVVNPNNRSWDFRYMIDGRERHMGLGPVHAVDLRTARERARACRLLLVDGIDPIEHRKAQRAAAAAAKAQTITFAEAAQRWFDQHESSWRNAKHRGQVLSTLKTTYSVLGRMMVSDIDTAAVLRAIEPDWLRTPETMNRTRQRVEAVLDWCTVRGYRTGDNPARWQGHLAEVLPARGKVAKVEPHAALPYAELPAFMAALRQRPGVAARALEFLVLTAARTGEALNAVWSEIDLDDRTWAVPENRMKAGREHRVALSSAAIALLRALPREAGNDRVFIGSRPGSGLSNNGNMLAGVLQRMRYGHVSVHGFRATFRTWASERTNFPHELAEMALAHAVGDKTERAYQRGDGLRKRYALAEAWAKFCASPPMTAGKGVVVSMHNKAGAHA